MADLRGQNADKESAPTAATKKPRRWQGRNKESELQSDLGRRAQRSGDAFAQAAAPTEGGASSEQGKGARDGCSYWITKEDLDRLARAGEGPSADQTRCGKAEACQGLAIECGAADNWGGREVSRINIKFTSVTI